MTFNHTKPPQKTRSIQSTALPKGWYREGYNNWINYIHREAAKTARRNFAETVIEKLEDGNT